MSKLIPPSGEQQNILKWVETHNVVVDAVAGSGKTTTVLHIASKFPTKKILLLTYNSKLRLETRTRVDDLQLKLEVHTYHSFGYQYFNRQCCTDQGLLDLTGFKPPRYDVVIIDEVQDMTDVYYRFVKKIITEWTTANNIFDDEDNTDTVSDLPNPQIIILGDKHQSIYGFNGADPRFIIYADVLFDLNKLPWKICSLHTSYRITNQMANFLNHCVFGGANENRIITAAKNGPMPVIVYSNGGKLHGEIMRVLRVYLPEDVFVLAASVRCTINSPLHKLANSLTKSNVNIYVSLDEERRLDIDVLKGKLVFSTFHQAKGLERKVVFVVGVDEGYYMYYNKTANRLTCPNELYVAMTRAKERLFIVQGAKCCAWMNQMQLPNYTQSVGRPEEGVAKDRPPRDLPVKAVTELVKHLSSDIISMITNMLQIVTESPKIGHINIPQKVNVNLRGIAICEEVADITGTAIPAYFEYSTTNRISIVEWLKCRELNGKKKKMAHVDYNKQITPEKLLMIVNVYHSESSHYNFRIRQIQEYNWLSVENLNKCFARLSMHVLPGTKMEVECEMVVGSLKVQGRIDCLYLSATENKIWEIKCTEQIKPEHLLQASLYSVLYHSMTGMFIPARVFNVLSGEILLINNDLESLKQILRLIIHKKFHVVCGLTDEEFIAGVLGEAVPITINQLQHCPECSVAQAEDLTIQ
jgi:hypothetical protein